MQISVQFLKIAAAQFVFSLIELLCDLFFYTETHGDLS